MTLEGRPAAEAAGPDSGHRLPATARLGTVRLQVSDLGRAEEFYTHVLGLGVAERQNDRLVLVAGDAREPLVELTEGATVRALAPSSRLGLFHFALLVPDRRALADFALHADRSGVLQGMSDHLVSEALYLRDPDGLGIEVYADRPRGDWQSRDGQWIMTTLPLDVTGLLTQTNGGPFGGLPARTVVGHVHFNVADLRDAARFYHGTLGLDEVVRDYPGALFFSAGGYHHHVGTNVWAPSARSPRSDDARLLSWTPVLPAEADVALLADAAVPRTERPHERGPRGGIVLSDPWGTRVEIIAEAALLPPLSRGPS